MFRLSFFRKFAISTLFLLLALILYSFPKELRVAKEEKDFNSKVYLVDKNEYVSLVNVACNIKDDNVLGIFELLTNSTCLPYGFSSYIPSNTKLLDYSISEGLLKINFSKDLFNVKKGYEEKVLEILIYSFTSIEEVEKVMLFIEGKLLYKLPGTNNLLPHTLDRSFGINKIVDITTLNENVSFNVYYLGKNDTGYYHIPVTYIVNNDGDVADMIIKRLKSNNISSSLLSHINSNVEMISYSIDEDVLGVTFDRDLENILFDGELSESVEYALVASFKDTFGVKNVNILFNS